MAVVIQEMVLGDRSVVVFGVSPVNKQQTALEAVHGLNQGLVDGTVEPDRWLLDRGSGKILSHQPAHREKTLMPGPQGIRLDALPHEFRSRAPLNEKEVQDVYQLVMAAESLFGSPQDVEWTYCDRALRALQARPITTRTESTEDQRSWYLSLHRSFDNLRELRKRIENELFPQMEHEAHEMGHVDLSAPSDSALAREVRRRRERNLLAGWRSEGVGATVPGEVR